MMTTFYCGGYFIVRPTPKEDFPDADILPTNILSASPCICEMYPDEEGFLWNSTIPSRVHDIQKLGLDEGSFQHIKHWINLRLENQQIGWPNVFFDLETAVEFYRTYLIHLPDLRCIGIGLSECHVKKLFDPSFIEEGGIFQCLDQKKPLSDNGKLLGYEVLGYDTNHFHSYLCNGLQIEYPNLGIELNSYGFITSIEQATEAAEYISGLEGVEVDLYLPWMIREYKVNCNRMF
jgi:hypothetical protein